MFALYDVQESEVPDVPTIRAPPSWARAISPAPDGTMAMVGMSGAARPRASSSVGFFPRARGFRPSAPRTARPGAILLRTCGPELRPAVRSREFLPSGTSNSPQFRGQIGKVAILYKPALRIGRGEASSDRGVVGCLRGSLLGFRRERGGRGVRCPPATRFGV